MRSLGVCVLVGTVIVAWPAVALAQAGAPGGKAPGAAKPSPATPTAPGQPVRQAKHPMIVEVLYSVPTGVDGDANKDGVRSATGDEFVELVNPHDSPIQLLGYTLSDESQGDKSKVRFTFPPLELKPGEVAVVFNGYGASWSGTVGDAKAAPSKKHADFASAYVFTMRMANNRGAFNNTGDSVTLFTPAGKAVQRVKWGTSAGSAQLEGGVLDESVPDASRGSVQRVGIKPGDAWRPHSEFAQTACSPGKYEVDIEASATPEEPVAKPGEAPAATPPKPEATVPAKQGGKPETAPIVPSGKKP